jgi:hypothetical protein
MRERVPRIVGDIRRGRVEAVSDAGEVLLILPGGTSRTVSIPVETVPLVRRLAALERELEAERRRATP